MDPVQSFNSNDDIFTWENHHDGRMLIEDTVKKFFPTKSLRQVDARDRKRNTKNDQTSQEHDED